MPRWLAQVHHFCSCLSLQIIRESGRDQREHQATEKAAGRTAGASMGKCKPCSRVTLWDAARGEQCAKALACLAGTLMGGAGSAAKGGAGGIPACPRASLGGGLGSTSAHGKGEVGG